MNLPDTTPQELAQGVGEAVNTLNDTVLGSLVILLGCALAYVLYRWIKYLVVRVNRLESEKDSKQ